MTISQGKEGLEVFIGMLCLAVASLEREGWG